MNGSTLENNINNNKETAEEIDNLNLDDYEEITNDLDTNSKKYKKRNDFTLKTKRILASRVGYKCSNPGCKRITIGPGTDPNKIILLGEAAHIVGAIQDNDNKTKSPRSDLSKTDEYIKSLENGIWLCASCHKLVDSDCNKYTVQKLKEWKKEAEARQAKELEEIKNDFIEKYVLPNVKSRNKGINIYNYRNKEMCLLSYVISIYIGHNYNKSRDGLCFYDLDNNDFLNSYSNWLSEKGIEYKTSGLDFSNTEYFLSDLKEICNKLVGVIIISDDGLNYGNLFEEYVDNILKDGGEEALDKIIKDLSIF